MSKPTHPVFLSLRKKSENLAREVANLTDFVKLSERVPAEFASAWGTAVSIGSGIRNAYNGMEDILKAIAKEIDGYVPSGGDWHQDLLDQMAVASEVRNAVLDEELYQDLAALKSFRHVVNHNYGAALKLDKVHENLDVLRKTYPAFIHAIKSFEASFEDDLEESEEDEP